MGRAAKANPRANGLVTPTDGPRNPSRVVLMQREVDTAAGREILRLGKTPRIAFSDRAYTIDRRGTFRRAPFFGVKAIG